MVLVTPQIELACMGGDWITKAPLVVFLSVFGSTHVVKGRKSDGPTPPGHFEHHSHRSQIKQSKGRWVYQAVDIRSRAGFDPWDTKSAHVSIKSYNPFY